jgi:hypothetical protein
MATVDHNPGELDSHHTLHLQQLRKYPSQRTIRRWIQRRNDIGHIRPFRRTGNHRTVREITGDSLVMSLFFEPSIQRLKLQKSRHSFDEIQYVQFVLAVLKPERNFS